MERLAASGRMPNFAAFVAAAVRGRLRSVPTGLSAMIWPKWFEGGHTGSWYFPKAWNPDRMCLEWTTVATGDPEPFWRDLDRRGLRTCIVDVPQAQLKRLNLGVQVEGWQVHDLFERGSTPVGYWEQLVRACGAPILGPERYGRASIAGLMSLRRQLLDASAQTGALAQALMKRGSFDVLVMVLGTLHRGGHYLWDASQVDAGGPRPEDCDVLEHSLDEIYETVDRSLGQVLELAPPGARVMIFSLHGMGPNRGWSERLQSIAPAMKETGHDASGPTLLERLKSAVPQSTVQWGVDQLPGAWQHRLLEFTSARLHDWDRTRWFVLPSDLSGFVRLNLAGREAKGIVPPGPQADSLLDELANRFLSLEDLDGRRIVAGVEVTRDFVDGKDRFRRYLPDLLLLWSSISASDTAGLRLNGREIARWPPGQRFDSGRSGNHTPEGWFAAAGPGLLPGRDETIHDISVLVPAVYRWLGLQAPTQMVGRAPESLAPESLGCPQTAER